MAALFPVSKQWHLGIDRKMERSDPDEAPASREFPTPTTSTTSSSSSKPNYGFLPDTSVQTSVNKHKCHFSPRPDNTCTSTHMDTLRLSDDVDNNLV